MRTVSGKARASRGDAETGAPPVGMGRRVPLDRSRGRRRHAAMSAQVGRARTQRRLSLEPLDGDVIRRRLSQSMADTPPHSSPTDIPRPEIRESAHDTPQQNEAINGQNDLILWDTLLLARVFPSLICVPTRDRTPEQTNRGPVNSNPASAQDTMRVPQVRGGGLGSTPGYLRVDACVGRVDPGAL